MGKTIAVRGKKETVAVLNKYGRLSGNQDQGRPQSMADIVRYAAGLSVCEDTKLELRAASKLTVDVSDIDEGSVPASIKIPVDVTDEEWDKAMDVFKYVFDLKGNPQMPYFIKVAGMAAIKKLEEQNAELGILAAAENVNVNAMDIDVFKELSTNDKLVEIYKLLIERGV
jgi:hypothetical protein